MEQHTSIIVLGVTGDLAKKKIIPSLYHLFSRRIIQKWSLIGVSNHEVSITSVLLAAKPYVEERDEQMWELFCALCSFVQCDITDQASVMRLGVHVQQRESLYEGPSHRMIYFAVASSLFGVATALFCKQGLCKKTTKNDPVWHRLVYEKPFGKNLIDACQLNVLIKESLCEEQIFRIDHYLTKEVVNNIAFLRFSNMVFEPLWSYQYIEQVHILLHETGGIEGRGYYYDAYGVLKDVVQNHVLQMLALVAMEAPLAADIHTIRDERAKVLQAIQYVDGVCGQYNEYVSEQFVSIDSHTPTYALLKFHVHTPRWQYTPFFVSTGKRMAENEVAIHIKFKKPLLHTHGGEHYHNNWLTITLSPDAIFSLQLNVKSESKGNAVVPVDMIFCHSCTFTIRKSQAYETLLEEVYKGRMEATVRYDEIEYAWRIIEQMEQKGIPLFPYEGGTNGPKDEIENFRKKHGMTLKKRKETIS